MYFGTHVDDIPNVHTRSHDGKIFEYFRATIQTDYMLKLTDWKYMLGGCATVVDHDEGYSTVTPDCIRLIQSTVKQHITDVGRILIQPKHIMASDGIKSLKFAEALPDTNPGRTAQLAMQSEVRTLIGVGHWVAQWHPQACFAFNAASAFAANPDTSVLTFVLHVFMYLNEHPNPCIYGGKGCHSLVLAEPTVPPFTPGAKEWGLHAAADSSILVDSISGGKILLAGAVISTVCQRQHLTSPDSYTSELVAAGTVLHQILPTRGQLLEVSIHQDQPTPLYIDSASTLFTIHDQRAIRRSLWTRRRARILQQAQEMADIIAIKIDTEDNFSDPETKSLIVKAWYRHLCYNNNLTVSIPDQ